MTKLVMKSMIGVFALLLVYGCGGTRSSGPPKPSDTVLTSYTEIFPGSQNTVVRLAVPTSRNDTTYVYKARVLPPPGQEFTSLGILEANKAAEKTAQRYCASLGKSVTSNSFMSSYGNDGFEYTFNCR